MKKIYVVPRTEAVGLFAEDSLMLTMSSGTEDGGQWTQRKRTRGGWNSEQWTGELDEEQEQ